MIYIIYYLVLYKIGLISQHIRAFSQVKSSKNAQRKDISVILLPWFFLSKAILCPPYPEDICQCLETFLIVIAKGILLASWLEARDNGKTSYKCRGQVPTTKTYQAQSGNRALLRSSALKSRITILMPNTMDLTSNSVPYNYIRFA